MTFDAFNQQQYDHLMSDVNHHIDGNQTLIGGNRKERIKELIGELVGQMNPTDVSIENDMGETVLRFALSSGASYDSDSDSSIGGAKKVKGKGTDLTYILKGIIDDWEGYKKKGVWFQKNWSILGDGLYNQIKGIINKLPPNEVGEPDQWGNTPENLAKIFKNKEIIVWDREIKYKNERSRNFIKTANFLGRQEKKIEKECWRPSNDFYREKCHKYREYKKEFKSLKDLDKEGFKKLKDEKKKIKERWDNILKMIKRKKKGKDIKDLMEKSYAELDQYNFYKDYFSNFQEGGSQQDYKYKYKKYKTKYLELLGNQ